MNTYPADIAKQVFLKGNPNALIPGVSTVYSAYGADDWRLPPADPI